MTTDHDDMQAMSDAQHAQDAEQRTNLDSLPADIRKYIDELRKESASYRVAAKAREAELARAEEAKLAEQQKWQELATLREQQVKELEPERERREALEGFVRDTVAKRIEALPEAYRTLVPEYDDPVKTLAWLDANAGTLKTPRPPALDAGVRGDSSTAVPDARQVSAAQVAAQYGYSITPEQLAARQKQIEQQRRDKPQGD
jgi:hypothetical protein